MGFLQILRALQLSANGVWHDLQAHVFINDTSSQVEIWLDGVSVGDLGNTKSLGSTAIRRIQLGDNTIGHIYDVAFDNILVNNIFIDMTPPTVALSEPSDNAIVREDVTLTADATDNSTIDRVEFFAAGNLIGTDYTSPYNLIWASSAVGDGPVTLTARAVDFGFNSATSAARIVTVDNTAPNVTINSGPSGTVNTDSATFAFSSGEPASFICFIDGEEIEDCDSPQTFNNLINGSHTFQVTATDAAGNNDPTPATQTWIVNVDTPTEGSDRDTTGVFRPSDGLLYLKNSNDTGFADAALNYGLPGDYPVVGDWDGNGTVTIGIYRQGYFYLKNANTLGFADIVFPFGEPGDQPIAGDWNGDGVDTIGIYRPSTGQFLLRNSNIEGPSEASFFLGNVGDVGVAGDWNGDGKDTTGVFRPSNGVIFLKDTNDTGFANYALNYGLPGDQPVMGDWNNDGVDTIGIYRNGTFYLRNENTNGFAEIVFGLGNPGDMPIAGNWDGIP